MSDPRLTALGEVCDWATAAYIAGEGMASVGPNGYYEMSPQEWLDWMRQAISRLTAEHAALREALEKLVGASEREELEGMELALRVMPIPAEDKAATIDAIHALLKVKR